MVRTKADGFTRVAAGGKAPKKSAGRPMSMPSPGGGEKGGKDHLPGNRACPRETPNWQKKITFFYDKNAASKESTEDSGHGSSSDDSKTKNNVDESPPKGEDVNNVEMEDGNPNVMESSKDDLETMETDE